MADAKKPTQKPTISPLSFRKGAGDRSFITQQTITPAKLERAKQMRDEMTPAEQKLWQRLRAGRLEGIHFRRQQVIEPYIVDFYCHQAALVIEVDGSIHQEQEEADRQRERELQARGLKVIRFSNLEVYHNMGAVLETILQACNPLLPSKQNLNED